MTDNSRIDDLRRRVEKDPASIAFAQLAEECRRAGAYQEAVDTCRAGLAIHPGYVSARVTLGRALVELGQLDEAHDELSRVLEVAADNLAAVRGLAEIYYCRGDLSAALTQYRAALLLASNDPDLEATIADLSGQIETVKPAPISGVTPPEEKGEKGDGSHFPPVDLASEAQETGQSLSEVSAETTPVPFSDSSELDGTLTADADDRATQTVAALEQWLAAIHVARDQRKP